jgi:hypothetical protein
MRAAAILGAGLLVALGACASNRTALSDPNAARTATTRRSNVITREELNEHPELISVADVIRQLRPGWPRDVAIYVNNDYFGDYSSLSTLQTQNVREIHSFSASEAQMKWGSRVHEVIQIVTR